VLLPGDVGLRTQVLDVLISNHLHWRAHCLAALLLRTERLEHDNAIGCGGCHEGGAVAELGPTAVVVEGDVAEAVAEGTEEERDMAFAVVSVRLLVALVRGQTYQ